MDDFKEIPRRVRIDRMTVAELAIRSATLAVEAAGADVRLTDAVNLLTLARERVADFVDGVNATQSATEVRDSQYAEVGVPASAPIPYSEGKKIYDQGWNDGIDHFRKIFMLTIEQRLRNR